MNLGVCRMMIPQLMEIIIKVIFMIHVPMHKFLVYYMNLRHVGFESTFI